MADQPGNNHLITGAFVSVVVAIASAASAPWWWPKPTLKNNPTDQLEFVGSADRSNTPLGSSEEAQSPAKDAVMERKETPIFSEGEAVVRGTWMMNLDSGSEEPDASKADFWWEQETDTNRRIVPKNGATFAIIDSHSFEYVSINDLRHADLTDNEILANDGTTNMIPTGTILAYKTKNGRFGKMLVENYGYNLTIRWVTFA